MLSHVTVGTNDFVRALGFYNPIMQALGRPVRREDASVPWKIWTSDDGQRPFFSLMGPFNGQPHEKGNGQMVALLAKSRDQVDDIHAIALANGGVCEGPPGLRTQYHENYYGAYFRDLDGNKLCVVYHGAN
ncbi:MAG: glyoxalase [Hirschia sp.]|nr:glyoxalase [Hirschia sp.]MBF19093.1 glyoxalase [Hirschia sp.]MBF20227.1 glyoxalase [Hirschia sp.]|tara:strand:- start:184 stop:576 length:393 start_codon:yes stop_codon:yes gene_type:complete